MYLYMHLREKAFWRFKLRFVILGPYSTGRGLPEQVLIFQEICSVTVVGVAEQTACTEKHQEH